MSGESKSRGIELTDEEMEQVAAGKSLILRTTASGELGFRCDCDDITVQEVKNHMFMEIKYGVCPKFSKREEPKKYMSCRSCIYYTDMGLMESPAIRDYRLNGYETGRVF